LRPGIGLTSGHLAWVEWNNKARREAKANLKKKREYKKRKNVKQELTEKEGQRNTYILQGVFVV